MQTCVDATSAPRSLSQVCRAANPIGSLVSTLDFTLPASSSSATSSLRLATSMPTQKRLIVLDLPRMRAHAQCGPKLPYGVVNEETGRGTYLTHGLRAPGTAGVIPARPRRKVENLLQSRHREDTRHRPAIPVPSGRRLEAEPDPFGGVTSGRRAEALASAPAPRRR